MSRGDRRAPAHEPPSGPPSALGAERLAPVPLLPRWITAAELSEASAAELLLFALAGGSQDRALDPLTSIGRRIDADLQAVVSLLGPSQLDEEARDLLLGISERMNVFCALLERTNRARRAP